MDDGVTARATTSAIAIGDFMAILFCFHEMDSVKDTGFLFRSARDVAKSWRMPFTIRYLRVSLLSFRETRDHKPTPQNSKHLGSRQHTHTHVARGESGIQLSSKVSYGGGGGGSASGVRCDFLKNNSSPHPTKRQRSLLVSLAS